VGDNETVLVEVRGGVQYVVLNRPDRANAIDVRTWRRLHSILVDVDPGHIRAFVLAGAGASFCSGGDIGAFDQGEQLAATLSLINDTVVRLHELPVPTVARVQGAARGAGLHLALACDMVIASTAATFGAPFVRRGIGVDTGGSWLLPRLVGYARARELLLLGRVVDARRAVESGLILSAVEPSSLDGAVAGVLAELGAGAPLALRATKEALARSGELSLRGALDVEADLLASVLGSEDAAEAVSAFVDGRRPLFKGV